MKTVSSIILAAVVILLNVGCTSLVTTAATGAGSKVLGGVVSSVANGNTIANAITSVLGMDKLSLSAIQGTWKYTGPGCAFTTDKALAKAGGEVVATQIKEKMLPTYQKLGLTSSNTSIVLNEDKTFTVTVAGKSFNGKYEYTESEGKLDLQGMLFSATCYTKRVNGGVAFLFESKKILTLLQTLASLSGNQDLSTLSDLSKNYDGVRLGMETAK